MSDIKWTNEQRAAIESRGGALLVSAAAGSGKTAVLTARAVGRMIDGNNSIDADRLLVVTFTRAAAREMKERLTVRLGEALQNDPGNAALRRQRTLLDSACIGTIHALCFNLLRQNFQRLNLPATFRIGQEQEIVLMHDEAVDAALEAAYGTGDTAFLSLVGLFAQKRGDASLAGALLRLLEFARSHPFYLDWMDERLRLYDDVQCPADSLWSGIILCHAMRLVSSARDICRRALLHIGADETLSAYASAFAGDLSLLEKLSDLIEQGDWDGICERLATFSHTRLSPVKHAREEDREALKSQRDMVKNLVEQLRQKLFSANAAEMREDVATLRPLVGCLFGLVREIDALLLARKQEKGILDFSDLEQMTLSLLIEKGPDGQPRRTEIARECAEAWDEVMIDEYQDVNAVQDMILWALSRDNNLFLVGDVKQSIYRFRLARPELFLQKSKQWNTYDGVHYPALLSLSGNFRSRPEVTGVINEVFSALMSCEAGDLEYDASQALRALARFPENEESGVELDLLDVSDTASEEEASAREADAVAARIEMLLSSGWQVFDNGESRSVTPGDICILLRSPKTRAGAYRDALSARGIDAALDLRSGFLTTPEISAMYHLLAALNNPARDVALAGALLSPLFGMDDDTLAEIRMALPRGGLYAALRLAAKSQAAAGEVLERFEALRRASVGRTAAQLICEIYAQTGFELLCGAMKNGMQRVANLGLLARYADDYHALGYRGTGAFVRLLDRMIERGEDLEAAKTGEGRSAVAITSIHRAKGLEWPVVFLADCARTHSFYQNDLITPCLLHSELGFASVRRDASQKKQYATVPLIAMRLESEQAMLSEELRVLYVAMTRARERLIITATCKKPEETLAALPPSEEKIPSALVLGQKTYLSWLLLALSRRSDWQLMVSDGFRRDGLMVRVLRGEAPATSPPSNGAYGPKAAPEAVLLEEMERRVTFVYPFAAQTRMPTKLAVSALTHVRRESDRFVARPAFLNQGGETGTFRGSATHAFMQLCDYEAARRDASAELERLRAKGLLTARQFNAVDPATIRPFFASPLAKRIFAADRVLREFRFMAPAAKSSLALSLLGIQSGHTMLQGVADCIFFEKQSAVVVDFKTDRVPDEQTLAERYAPQLLLYRDMLSDLLPFPVEECVLWSFALQRQIMIDGVK